MSSTQPLLSLVMIVKNERLTIQKTLASTLPHVDRYTILDTGSTDGTQEIIQALSKEHSTPGRVLEEPFVDFATSRNRCLALAGQEAVYFLSMDANDELREGGALVDWCRTYQSMKGPEHHSFLVRVRWNNELFSMQRLFRSDAGCRYVGRIHEHLETEVPPSLTVESAYVFHERDADEAKSRERWVRDCQLLEEELEDRPEDSRAMFYLAQSYVLTGRYQEGFDLYSSRAALGGPDEETFIALFRRAELAERFLQKPWEEIEQMYQQAHHHSPTRAEPLVRLGHHHANQGDYERAYHYLRHACDLPIPYDCTMNIDLELYEFGRWDLLGSVAYFVGRYDEGMQAIEKAMRFPDVTPEARRQLQINLQVYLNRPRA